jgi:hypothetical protein
MAQSQPHIADSMLHRPATHRHPHNYGSGHTVKLWIFALGAVAMIAARAAYGFRHRRRQSGVRFTIDQVSSDWLATARIHEDQD